jgi:serine/threonine protein kinase
VIANLEREIRLMRRFQHPNILRFFTVLHNVSLEEVYLILEYVTSG